MHKNLFLMWNNPWYLSDVSFGPLFFQFQQNRKPQVCLLNTGSSKQYLLCHHDAKDNTFQLEKGNEYQEGIFIG